MEKTEARNKKGWSIWAIIAFVLFWLVGLTIWGYYEKTQLDEMKKEKAVAGKPILHISKQSAGDLCECPKPKARVSRKKSEPKQKPVQQAKTKPPFVVDEVIAGWRAPPKAVAENKKVEAVAESQEEDFYDKAVMPRNWETEPEEEVAEVEPPRVGRKILVIRQQPVMPYYGGYSSGYYPSYAPQVTYGQPYIPPPQTVFVPAPPVIVPAPSVVTPAGGYKPQGSTGGHSPSGTTGTAL